MKKRTRQFSLSVIKLFGTLPKTTEAQIIGKQLLRSATSVGAHYHEATQARSDAELIAKLGCAQMELEETGYWIELLSEAAIVHPDKLATLRDETAQLKRIFTTVLLKLKSRNQPHGKTSPLCQLRPHQHSFLVSPSFYLMASFDGSELHFYFPTSTPTPSPDPTPNPLPLTPYPYPSPLLFSGTPFSTIFPSGLKRSGSITIREIGR